MRSSRTFRLFLWFGLVAAFCGSGGLRRSAAQGYVLGAPVLAVNTGNHPVFVATADVNGDGKPDLIYIDAGATPSASTTHVLLGDGKGGFTQSAVLETAGVSVAIGDLRGTGHIDLGWMTSYQKGGSLYAQWHVAGGAGDGTFDAPTVGGDALPLNPSTITQLPVFTSLKAGDTAGQANTVPEIVAVDSANDEIFAVAIETGGLNEDYTALVDGAGPLTLGDLNNDSYTDILVDAQSNATVQVFVGQPSSSGALFGVNGGYFSGATGVQSLALGDFNGDGKLDMAAEDPLGQIDIFPGNGDGSFQTSSIGSTSSVDDSQGDGGTLIAAADLNKDGALDLLAFSPLGVSVEIGTPSGNFDYTGSYPGGTGTGTNGQFATADFNGDGVLDVALDAPNGIVILDGSLSAILFATPPVQYYGGAFTITAVVGPDPGGTVSFTIDGSSLGAPVDVGVNGSAVFQVPQGNTYAIGTHALTGNWIANSSTAPQLLTGSIQIVAPVTIALNSPSSYFGDAFTITANVSGAVGTGGTATLTIDQTSLGQVSVGPNGVATWTVPAGNTYTVGQHTLRGVYNPNNNAPPVPFSGTHQVVALPTPTGTLNTGGATKFEAAIPVSVTFNTPTGQPVPTGTVTFTFAGANPPVTGTATLANGTASYSLPPVAPNTGGNPVLPGTSTVTATYSGDANYSGTTLTGTQTVMLGVTTVTLTGHAPTPVLEPTYFYGQLIDGSVNFEPQDTQFRLKGTWEQLSNGVPVPGCTALAIPNSMCPYGDPIVIPAGPYVWVERYNGGPANGDPVNGTGDSAPYVFTVQPDTTTASTLTSSMNPAPVGTAVTFTETLTGNMAVPTGAVQFFADGNLLGTGTLNATGQASFTTSSLKVGSHQITAVYAATLNFDAATSPALTEIITAVPLASAVTLASSLNPSLVGQPVTFTAVASVPGPFPFQVQSGTITFLDGATAIGTGQINQFGQASLTTTSLAVGSHAITASYPGGSSAAGQTFAPSVSAVLTQVVETAMHVAPPGITLTVTPNPVTLKPGSTGVLLVTVAALSGFDQPTSLTCTGTNSSNELGCSFIDQTIAAGGGSTTLDLVTTAPYPCGSSPTHPYFKQEQAAVTPSCGLHSAPQGAIQQSGWRTLAIGAPMVAGLMWLWPRRRRRFARLLALVILAGVIGLSGCGGNCSNLGTRPGSYSVTVTAKAGTVTQQVVVNLSVLDPT